MASTHVIDGPPELFAVRNALYLGNYTMSLGKAQQTNVSNDLKTQKDVLMYRAHIGLGDFDIVINEIKDNKETHVSLRVCYTFILMTCQ
jgi:coatomer protein complex subunit epsilon